MTGQLPEAGRVMSRRSWGLGPKDPPDPRIPVPQNPPKPGKLARFEAWVLQVMFATPIPAVWNGEGIR